MKRIQLLATAFSLLLAIPCFANQPQSRSAPDQVPEGLEKSDWQSIRAAHEAWKHEFRHVDGQWQAHNPGQQWITTFDGRGFLATPQASEWTWGLQFKNYGFGENLIEISGTPEVYASEQRLSYHWNENVEEWFINDQRGLEHGFIIKERPEGGLTGEPLVFTMATVGPLKPTVSKDTQTVHFRDAANAPVLNYSGLKVWDADGNVLTSRFEPGAGGTLRLVVEESEARYPITIDPIAQQAYLKAGNNGSLTNDEFGYSVAISGDTVVVGARREDSSASGVDAVPDQAAGDSGAAYVFVRSGNGWIQQTHLKASNTGLADEFGWSVAVSGDTIVVGAPFEDSSSTGVNGDDSNDDALNSGAVYVFTRNGNAWSQEAYLKASNTGIGDQFGFSVAISGDTVVVGARQEGSDSTGVNGNEGNNNAIGSGAAYVFTRTGITWSQQAYLKASNTGLHDAFGCAVSVSLNTVVVGARNEESSSTGVNGNGGNNSASSSGAAYVFTRSGTTWSQQAYLKASNTGAGDEFGRTVAVSGDTIVVGAPFEDSSSTGINGDGSDNSATNFGAAYVFFRNGSTWTQQAYLKPSALRWQAFFGFSVAISANTVVVGARNENSATTGVNSTPDSNATGSGAAYVFQRNGSIWSQQAYLKASNTGAADALGWSVAVSGNTVVIGAPNEDSGASGVNNPPNDGAPDAGAAYVFALEGGLWSQEAFLKASNASQGLGAYWYFGQSVAISGDTVVVGAPDEDSSSTGVNSAYDTSASASGAAYVFVRSGGVWSQQAYLKASNTRENDLFGWSVAVSGDTVVIGAVGEDSGTTGVDSTPEYGSIFVETSGYNSGAAYVFVRSGGTWSEQAYLKAFNTGYGDQFGCSVAVSGDTVVVGARGEDSSSIGVNSIPNEGASDSGAAYMFVRNSGSWSQQAYLKASNTDIGNNFGQSVAVSGDTVVVGAPSEGSSTTGVNSVPNNSAPSSGAAYVFERSGTTWSQQAYLKASNTGVYHDFGASVAVSADTVVVGAKGENSSTTGVNSTPNTSVSSAGAAYVFVRSDSTWSQQAYLKASNTEGGDSFGHSVAVSVDIVVVGAPGEASSTTGINSIPNDGASGAGAAYVFERSGTTWIQQAYLKAFNAGENDRFGHSVAISGSMVVVGAPNEDSGTSGVNSLPDENAPDSGAAYIFTGFGLPPSITAVSPPSGSVNGGTEITISGSDFSDADSVLIGGIPALNFTIVNSTTITATTPNGAAGPVNVSVATPLGIATGVDAFTYLNVNAQAGVEAAIASAGLTGEDAEFNAIPFNDGVENLLKYAFNMNLAGPDVRTMADGGSAGLPSISQVGDGPAGILRIEFVERIGSGLVYTPKKSTSLDAGDWLSLTDVPTIIPIDDNWQRVIYEEPANPVDVPKCFGRVEVVLPAP